MTPGHVPCGHVVKKSRDCLYNCRGPVLPVCTTVGSLHLELGRKKQVCRSANWSTHNWQVDPAFFKGTITLALLVRVAINLQALFYKNMPS